LPNRDSFDDAENVAARGRGLRRRPGGRGPGPGGRRAGRVGSQEQNQGQEGEDRKGQPWNGESAARVRRRISVRGHERMSLGMCGGGVTGITRRPSGEAAASCGGLSSPSIPYREGQGVDRGVTHEDLVEIVPRRLDLHSSCHNQRRREVLGGALLSYCGYAG